MNLSYTISCTTSIVKRSEDPESAKISTLGKYVAGKFVEASGGSLTNSDKVVISLHVKAREVQLQTFCVITAESKPVALAIGRRVRDVERGAVCP